MNIIGKWTKSFVINILYICKVNNYLVAMY